MTEISVPADLKVVVSIPYGMVLVPRELLIEVATTARAYGDIEEGRSAEALGAYAGGLE